MLYTNLGGRHPYRKGEGNRQNVCKPLKVPESCFVDVAQNCGLNSKNKLNYPLFFNSDEDGSFERLEPVKSATFT